METCIPSKDAPAHALHHPDSPSPRANQAEVPLEEPPSSWYKVAITAFTFTSFLLSLLLVDIRYSSRRTPPHGEAASRLPSWVHKAIYHPKPPKKTHSSKKDPGHTSSDEGSYYHSNQKKLMKMEAEEAFKLKNTVMALALGLIILAIGLSWMALKYIWRYWIMGRGG